MRVLFVGVNEKTPKGGQHREHSQSRILRQLGVHVDVMPLPEAGRLSGSDLSRHLRVKRHQMPWDDYDFFHVPSAIVAGRLAKARKGGAKVVFDCQGLRFAEVLLWKRRLVRLRSRVWLHLERRAARLCDLCATVSKPLKRWLADVRGATAGIEIIRNAVDASLFAPDAGDTRARQGNPFLVGYAGQFQAWQAVDLLIGAARELAGETNIRWRIIGFRESDRDIKRRFAEALGEGAELIDLCDRARLVGLLRECDLLTIPRKPYLACQVALPTKFAEYLAMAKPVLVNTVDETQDIVRQIGCGFVAESDPRAMAEAIRQAADTSPEALRAMGQAGRAYVMESLNLETVGRRYKAFLEANL